MLPLDLHSRDVIVANLQSLQRTIALYDAREDLGTLVAELHLIQFENREALAELKALQQRQNWGRNLSLAYEHAKWTISAIRAGGVSS